MRVLRFPFQVAVAERRRRL